MRGNSSKLRLRSSLRRARACGSLALLAGVFGHACSSSEDGSPERARTPHDSGLSETIDPKQDGSTGATGGSGGSGSGGAGGGGAGSGAVDGASSDRDATPTCDSGTPLTPTGKTIDVTPPATLDQALSQAEAGDRIVLHAGTYASEQISDRRFSSYVFIEAAAGQTVSIPGARFRSSDHLAIRGVRFAGTVQLDGSSHFMFQGVTLDAGSSDEAALHIHGQGSAGASHDVLVEDSTLLGGGRTVFVLGRFAPSDEWNHHITFVRNEITCGSRVCFQLSGARDLVIEENTIHGTAGSGVLTAGATRINISRNRFRGTDGESGAAMQIATPGREWDNYAGVEHMISSAVVIANNVVDGWTNAVQLDAARDVAIVYNTVADGVGLKLHHRTPHDQSNNVILDGNSEIRLWNNILPTISIDAPEQRPAYESNNLVWQGGGGGTNLVSSDPGFASGMDYALSPQSPAIDAATIDAQTPLIDFEGHARGARPDIGARELGAMPPECP